MAGGDVGGAGGGAAGGGAARSHELLTEQEELKPRCAHDMMQSHEVGVSSEKTEEGSEELSECAHDAKGPRATRLSAQGL
jgi:hypothetical protein